MATKIIEYYNSNLKKRIDDFVEGNERICRATDELLYWITLYKPKNILEIGCGIGDISFKLAEIFPDSEIIGFDISDKTIEFGKSIFELPNLKLKSGKNFYDLDLEVQDESLDFIFLIDVFEHFQDNDVLCFIQFLKKKTLNNSLIFLSCPTIKHQNYLRKHNPKGLQPIDKDIDINHFVNLANQLKMDLLFFKCISVWNSSDYQHAVIGRIPDLQKFSDKHRVIKKGIKLLLKERLLKRKKIMSVYDTIRAELRKNLNE